MSKSCDGCGAPEPDGFRCEYCGRPQAQSVIKKFSTTLIAPTWTTGAIYSLYQQKEKPQ